MNQDNAPEENDPLEEEQDDAVIGQALRGSARLLILFAVLGLVGWLALRWAGRDSEAGPEIAVEAPTEVPSTESVAGPPAVTFTDVTQEWGLDWTHESGARGDRFLPETMGAGAAFFDADNDGDPDLLLLNSDTWDGSGDPRTAFYENREGRFVDRSKDYGLDLRRYATAVAVGDVDGDGDRDLFIATLGANLLLENRADGETRRFVDVTAAAGVAGDSETWSSSSAFFDADGDGDLDLFVGNYVRWSKEIDVEVDYKLVGEGRAYGQPVNYGGTLSYLFRNDGDGRFQDVSAEAGVEVLNSATGEPVGKALGVVPTDIDLDGDLDVLVANDTVRNFLFLGQGDGSFEEVGELYGVAYGRDGTATGAMGIDVAYYRGDANLGIAIGNFANEMTSLYVAQGDPSLFADESIPDGIGAPSRRMLSFGVFFFDYDLDGRQDLLQVNGHLDDQINQVDPSQTYRQAPQLFWNAGDASPSTFLEVDLETAGDLAQQLVGRASTYADVDGDGDLDVLLLQTGGPPVLLRNDQDLGHHWLRLRLQPANGGADALGALVEVTTESRSQRRELTISRSYQSQVESVLTFGLGAATSASVRVVWKDGTESVFEELEIDRLHVLEQPTR
ncbi:MAG: CRTAC1 family protein [Acidobacteriota bacterium]